MEMEGQEKTDDREIEKMLLTYECFPWVSNKSSRSSLFVENELHVRWTASEWLLYFCAMLQRRSFNMKFTF